MILSENEGTYAMAAAKKDRIRKLADQVGRDLEIEAFESFFMQMNSSGELCVRSVGSVRVCTEEEIVLVCRYMLLHIKGNGLRMLCFSERETVIAGRIAAISFLWEGNAYAV